MTPFHLYLYGAAQGPLPASFEDAESRLSELPSLHFEPDGSFFWTREAGREHVDGMLYDASGQIQYCVLQGHCSVETWQTLLRAIVGDGGADQLEILRLPQRRLQDLQTFEAELAVEN